MLDLKLTDMRFMYLTGLRGKDICVGDKKCKRVKIYVGRPLRDTPKTYKQIGGFVQKNYPTLITAVVLPSMKQRIKRSDIRFIETVVFILITGSWK